MYIFTETVKWLMLSFQIILLIINTSMIIHSTVIIIIKETKDIRTLKGFDAKKNIRKSK